MIEIAAGAKVGLLEIEIEIAATGRVLALCGPSGAGKTTLLNMIAGVERPLSGRIAIDGETFFDARAGIDRPARDRRLGYVFQEPRLFPHLTAAGNLGYGARFAPRGEKRVGFDEVVALLGVSDLLKRFPARLSGGEKQRVAIGRALLSQPRALLLDEPLNAIDDARRQEILGLIEKLRDAFDIPMILVSHRPDEIARLANDIALIEGGKLKEMRRGSGGAE